MEWGFDVPDIPFDTLVLEEDATFRGDLYRMIGEQDGAPETITVVRPPQPKTNRAGRMLIIGDSFVGHIQKYFDANFERVDVIGNNSGKPDLSEINPGTYDAILFEIVERLSAARFEPITEP